MEPFKYSLRPSPSCSKNPVSNDNAKDVVDNFWLEWKINKRNSTSTSLSSSQRNDSSQEIAEGNCLEGKKKKCDGKINTTTTEATKQTRFFDIRRRAGSASQKFLSISPSKLVLRLTSNFKCKRATNHELSQLKRPSNLFIGDESERKINKQAEGLMSSMENGPDVNTKHQQNSLEGKDEEKSKKSSLISSFNFKIPSTNRTNGNGNFNKNLCTNFSPKTQLKSSRDEASSDAYGNYEEIDIADEEDYHDDNVARKRQDMITNAPDALNDKNRRSNCFNAATINFHRTMENFSPENFRKEKKFNSIESCNDGEPLIDFLSKPEFNSNVFKNIPVRPRKGQVPHMDNYCLFDPSVDFCNEKEMWRKNSLPSQFEVSLPNFLNFQINVNERQRQQPQLVHNTFDKRMLRHDPGQKIREMESTLRNETVKGRFTAWGSPKIRGPGPFDSVRRKSVVVFHNYHVIDPVLLEQDEAELAAIDNNQNKEAYKPSIKTQVIRQPSSSSSSCDYPCVTTPSSPATNESTDEYGFCRKMNDESASNLDNPTMSAINQMNVGKNVTIVTATGTKKKTSQFSQIVDSNLTEIVSQQDDLREKSARTNLNLFNVSHSLDVFPSKNSLSQLENIIDIKHEGANNEICERTKKSARKSRSLSSESLDSGFTTPSPLNEAPLTKSLNSLIPDVEKHDKTEPDAMTFCDNIQKLIEVSLIQFLHHMMGQK